MASSVRDEISASNASQQNKLMHSSLMSRIRSKMQTEHPERSYSGQDKSGCESSCDPDADARTMQSSIQSSYGQSSSYCDHSGYIGSIHESQMRSLSSASTPRTALHAGHPPSPLPFAMEDDYNNNNSLSEHQLETAPHSDIEHQSVRSSYLQRHLTSQHRSQIHQQDGSNLFHFKQQQSGLTASPSSIHSEEGGIVILNPTPESNANLYLEQSDNDFRTQHQYEEPLDSIIAAAAAHVDATNRRNTQTNREMEGSNFGFETLLEQAEGHDTILNTVQLEETTLQIDEDDQSLENEQGSIWDRLKRSIIPSRQSPANTTLHPPVRANRLSYDKFLVEVDILPNNQLGNYRADVREAIDIMANVHLLHLWFDPIPAVFDSTIKDGSGSYSSPVSPRSSPSNSANSNERESRHHDGEWIEISTPPLILPRDSRISSCLRSTRVGVRSLIGFPPRIKSVLFIERSARRMGMTIGPYSNGMTVYHSFNVRVDDERMIISDEVRLHRSEVQNRYYFCCICGLLRAFFRIVEWLLFRWYQPDLASYMSQTKSSLEKLRNLVERGEGGAYATDELVMEGDEWDKNTALISAPLLG